MEKLYTKEEFATLAQVASSEGKMLYKIQKFVDYEVEVFEYEKKTIEVPVYDEETGLPTGETQTIEVDDLTKPIMIDGFDEEGNPIKIHKHHTETRQKFAEVLDVQPLGYYICSDENITDGTLNPDFEQEQEAREREKLNKLSLTKREVFLALYQDKGLTPEQLRSNIKDAEALIEFDYANDYFRGNPLIDSIGATLGYSSADLDYLFLNKKLPNHN